MENDALRVHLGLACALLICLGAGEAGAAPPAPSSGTLGPLPFSQKRCEADRECPARSICVEGSCKPAEQSVNALFYFSRPGPHGHRIVVPFYFSFFHPTERTRVLVPFFVWHRNDEKKSTDLWIPPLLYQHHRDPETRAHRVWPIFFYADHGKLGKAAGMLPLFYGESKGNQTTVVLPPLLTLYRNNTKTRLRDFLFLPGLTFVRSRPQSAFGLFGGLGWYRRVEDRAYGGFFPLAWHFASRARSTTVVLPLFMAGADREQGLRHLTLLPLFHYRSEEQGKRTTIVTPLFGHHRNKEEQSSVSVLLVPPLVHRDEPRYRLTVIPPLAMWWRNKETGHSAGYTGPVFWSADDEGSVSGVLPLYLRFHNARPRATTHILIPLLAVHTGPAVRFGMVGPVFGWSRRAGEEAAAGGGVVPLFTFATGKRSHFTLLPPLLAYFRDRERGSLHLSLGPLFFRRHERGQGAGWDAGLLPLLYFGRRGQERYQMVLPLLYHRGGPAGRLLVLGPLYLSTRASGHEAGYAAGLFPLLWLKRTAAHGYLVVPPLLWLARSGRSSVGVVGPVFWRRDRAGTPEERVAGGLFPLLYMSRSRQAQTAIFPLGAYHNTAHRRIVVAGPYLHTRERAQEGQGTISTHVVFPLFFMRSAPDHSAHVLFPLFFQGWHEGTTVRSAAFLYYGVSRPALSVHVLLPIFGSVRTGASRTTIVGPGFYHARADSSTVAAGLLPLFGYGRSKRLSVFAWPLGVVLRDHSEERSVAVMGTFYGDFRPSRSDYGLLPLLFAWRRGTASSFLLPFVYHGRDPAQGRSLTVIGPLYFGHRGPATFGGLAPLLFGRNDGRGSYQFTAVPLFHFQHWAGKLPKTQLLTALFGFSRSSAGFWAYLGPAYLRRDAESQSEALLPFFYHTRNLRTDVSTTLVLPLYFRTRSPQSSLTAVTPLFWQYSTLTSRTTLLLPFVLDSHQRFERRLTAVGPLLPLVIRSRSYAADTTAWVFPPLLTYVKRHADGHHDGVVFPLFWHYGGVERSTTVLIPLFGNLRRPAYHATFLLPIFLRYKELDSTMWMIPPLLTYLKRFTDGRTTAITFPLFYYSGSKTDATAVFFPLIWHSRTKERALTVFLPLGAWWKTPRALNLLVLNIYMSFGVGARRGAWDFHFWPLFSFGRPRPHDLEWNVLGGVVGYSRLGVNRTLRLLWGLQVPLQPVGARSAWYGATLRMGSYR